MKIRQPEHRKPKYGEVFRDRPTIFPAPSGIRAGKPLILCEGEFDALLLRQELEDYDLAVVTMGSASNHPDAAIQDIMLAAPIWYLALDSDQAGDINAASWPARAKRIKPPAPHKDWGEVHQSGYNRLRYLWGGVLRRPHTPRAILETVRWGSMQTEGSPS